MTIPAFTYDIHDLPGLENARPQAVGSADRPLCALMSCLASQARGNMIRGQALGWPDQKITDTMVQAAHDRSVPIQRLDRWVRALNGSRLPAHPPLSLQIEGKRYDLDAYQIAALDRLTVAGGVFALDMGLGKTATSVAGVLSAKVYGYADPSRVWIVCPLNAMGAWEPFVPLLQASFAEVRILSVDSAHKYSATTPTGGALIFDEVHQLGAHNARRTAHCHQLRRLFDFAICNTGTLLHAGIEKVLSILDLAVPGAAQFASRWRCGEHFNCLVKKQIGSRTVTALEKPSAEKEIELAEYLSNYVTILDTDSTSVRDSVSIPPQEDHEVDLALPWLPMEDAVVAEVEKYLARGEDLPSMPEIAHLLCRSGIDEKIAWLDAHLDESPLVLFAHYTDTMDALEAWCQKRNLTYRRIDGTTPQTDRPLIEAAFQKGEFQVLLGQMRAAGIALNLQRAWITVAVDFSWNPVDYAQAKRRTRRRGQTRDCFHFDLVANRLQHTVLARIRAGCRFNASVAAYQDMRTAYTRRAVAAGLAVQVSGEAAVVGSNPQDAQQ